MQIPEFHLQGFDSTGLRWTITIYVLKTTPDNFDSGGTYTRLKEPCLRKFSECVLITLLLFLYSHLIPYCMNICYIPGTTLVPFS